MERTAIVHTFTIGNYRRDQASENVSGQDSLELTERAFETTSTSLPLVFGILYGKDDRAGRSAPPGVRSSDSASGWILRGGMTRFKVLSILLPLVLDRSSGLLRDAQ
jgi:hypothetical protein